MIRVMFITHYADYYGANRSMLALIDDLQTRYDVKATVILPFKGPIVDELKKSGIDYDIFKFYPWRKKNPHFVKDKIKFAYNNLIVARKIAEKYKLKFDVIHTNSSVIEIGQSISDILKIPHVWHLREFGLLDYDMKYTVPHHMVNHVMTRTDRLVCISKAIYEYYKNQICVKGNYQTIYNGVTLGKKSIEKVYKTDRINFCCVGVVVPGKGQLEILKAANHLLQKYESSNFCIHFIGGKDDKEYYRVLSEYINDNCLQEYVKFWGFQKQVGSILYQMDVGIMSSISEAFGRVTIEYMLSGMPVIGTRTGGTIEIVEDKISGLLYESGNYEDLATKMKMYLDDSKLLRKHGMTAQKIANDRFSKEQNTDNIFKLYLDVSNE